ncbi:MAG: hypothetical protein GX847_02095 [Clostridiales bacterium]|nr:hypothetical protein [Clostridiales bacterium]
MKKITKAFTMTVTAAAVLLFVLLPGTALGQSPLSAESTAGTPVSREEVVYANLTAAGVTKDIYIVSALRNAETGTVTDYGNYASVKNLTDTGPVTLTDDRVTFNAPKGDFYYQGTLNSTDLPWKIAVTYELDGVELPPEALAGKSGRVTIHIKTTRNDAVDPVYFENYLLQISLTLDTTKCANITAPGGTVANAGINKLVAFTVMPGKAGDVTLETDASDFAMNGIEFSAVPLSMQFDTPDTDAMKEDLTALTDAVSELSNGIARLESGARELKNGTGDLSGGSASFASGLRDLSGSAAGLYGGSAQIKDALNTIAGFMSGAPDAGGSLDLAVLQYLP